MDGEQGVPGEASVPTGNRASRLRRFVLCLFLAAVLPVVAACGARVTPPLNPAEPVEVFLIDYGYHASLVIPSGDGYVEFAYGDWRYMALPEETYFNGLRALLWPTRATLGRRVVSEDNSSLTPERIQNRTDSARVYELTVDRREVDLLARRFEEWFRSRPVHRNRRYGSDHVEHPTDYWAFHNSNHAVFRWLEDLDVEVYGFRTWSSFTVRDPE